MTSQTVSQIVLLLGVVLSAFGAYGSYHYGKLEEAENKRESDKAQNELKTQIKELQANTSQISDKADLIFQALKVKTEIWMEVEMKNVPAGITDYLLLLFASDKGRISGKVRIKGSENVASFSTTANNSVPVAVRNLWLPKEGQYKIPTIMEFAVTEKTEPDASLSIYTQGFIWSRGQEPH
ncbi:MAG: hypothetical protein CAF41_013930 [Nitrospira sp. CG24A]|nr:MAG: hypothetical protein CAF41_013930 [Nitrospira sp. CG24A]